MHLASMCPPCLLCVFFYVAQGKALQSRNERLKAEIDDLSGCIKQLSTKHEHAAPQPDFVYVVLSTAAGRRACFHVVRRFRFCVDLLLHQLIRSRQTCPTSIKLGSCSTQLTSCERRKTSCLWAGANVRARGAAARCVSLFSTPNNVHRQSCLSARSCTLGWMTSRASCRRSPQRTPA